METLHRMGLRWKQYEKEGKWVYEQHPFWCTGYTYVSHSPLIVTLSLIVTSHPTLFLTINSSATPNRLTLYRTVGATQ